MAEQNIGKVVSVIGPVLDVEFEPEHLPDIYNALHLKSTTDTGQDVDLVAEVQQHIGRGQVRAVAMTSTDGVVRGMEALDTGSYISVPVGDAALGRILNVLGNPVDEAGPLKGEEDGTLIRWPISSLAIPSIVSCQPATSARLSSGTPGPPRDHAAYRY